jgi:hypothetical protein
MEHEEFWDVYEAFCLCDQNIMQESFMGVLLLLFPMCRCLCNFWVHGDDVQLKTR